MFIHTNLVVKIYTINALLSGLAVDNYFKVFLKPGGGTPIPSIGIASFPREKLVNGLIS